MNLLINNTSKYMAFLALGASIYCCSPNNPVPDEPGANPQKGKVTVSDWQIDNLKGRVKSVSYQDGTTYEYNANGFKIKNVAPNGETYNVQYNPENFIIYEEYHEGNIKYEFDEKNRRIKEITLIDHGDHTHTHTTTYSYSSDKEGTFKKTDGYYTMKEGAVKLNDNMTVIEKITRTLNRKGGVVSTETATYNDAQVLTSLKVVAPDGKLISHYEDAFNDNYQLVSNRKLLDDGSYASLTCSYGTHGFVTKREESHKGKLYNIEFTYELDDRGNWTKRTEIVNANEHHETKERAIEYYR